VVLRGIRACASAIAPVLLVSLIALAMPHVADSHHDPDSQFALAVAHDPAAHGIGTPSSNDEAPPHCAICHWARSFRPLTNVAFHASAFVQAAGLTPVDVFRVATADSAGQPPLRAPPSFQTA